MRACFFVAALLVVTSGCAVGDGAPVTNDTCDAGVDAGPDCEPAESDNDDGGTGASSCEALIAKTCGVDDDCARDPGCNGATLLARFEPDACEAALTDDRTYPSCAVGSCSDLVDKVCGGDDRCASDPGCAPARALQARADDGDADANTSCNQALSDELLFPRCGS